MLTLDETKDVLRELIAGMGTLNKHISLYRLVHITTRGTSLESLARVEVGGFRGSPEWLSWPLVEN